MMRVYLPVIRLPGRIDYTPKASPVRDQGNEGAWSLVDIEDPNPLTLASVFKYKNNPYLAVA